jgi:hypothetical protein
MSSGFAAAVFQQHTLTAFKRQTAAVFASLIRDLRHAERQAASEYKRASGNVHRYPEDPLLLTAYACFCAKALGEFNICRAMRCRAQADARKLLGAQKSTEREGGAS